MSSRNCCALRRAVCAAAAVLVLATGCLPDPAPPPTDSAVGGGGEVFDGHAVMLDMLQQIKAVRPQEALEFGPRPLEEEAAAYARLPDTAEDRVRFGFQLRLGERALFVGDNDQAVEMLTAAYQLLPKVRDQFDEDPWEHTVYQLALAHLRIAETENCVHCRTGESCLLPIRPGGIHQFQDGSRKAIEYLQVLLAEKPDDLRARWLLNIAYLTIGGYPDDVPEHLLVPPEAFESEEEFPEFRNVAAKLDLDTVSLAGGAVVDDFNGDDLLDIMVSSWGEADQLRLYVNQGDGTFRERTKEAGLTGILGGLNLIHADYDNDGDADVLVLRGAWLQGELSRLPNSLLRNDGRGNFRDVTFESGLGDEHYPTQTAAWADYDNDGDVDLLVGNEGAPCQLFQNDGKGHFEDVAAWAGVDSRGVAKGVAWGDFDNDRHPDLYVSNLDGPNRLYRNRGDGTFEDVTERSGVGRPDASFGCWFWDFDNDGALDLWVGSYDWGVEHIAADYLSLESRTEPDRLYQGDGRGGFRDVAGSQNLHRVTQPMGANFGDLDNDGYPDFYLGTGYPDYEALMPNLMFHNRRGQGFADVTTSGGFGHLQKGHGIAFADLDHDGDQDVFAELGGSKPGDTFCNALFENPGFGNHWLKLKLVGVQSNRLAIGARVRLEITERGERRTIHQWVTSGGSFGANPLRREIGLGSATKIDTLSVYWPTSGTTQTFRNVAADQFLEVTEGQDALKPIKLPATPW